ncbi:hypothetical protein LTR10_017443 [Elasticomyces elasticus]|nr:hypothetical protein LTR10_017443 [Elasticomyces elasticus]
MPPDADDLFTSDPNWAAFAKEHGYLKPSPLPSAPVELDLATNRANQTISEAEWARSHPLSSFGYTSCLTTVKVRDGTEISVKLSYPTRQQSQTKLPVLFVTHGGGWVQGTHITEEAWLLWPLYSVFDLAVISVEYRLASEHKFPTWMDDSWDVLERLLSDPEIFVSKFQPQAEISLDAQKVILSGSSAGAGTAAYLSQTCRDKNIPIYGVVLNVPVLCDYRHLPSDCRTSYDQCTDSLLSSGEMRAVWDLIIPSATVGADLKASPLLGRVEGLRKHLIFVAGQDPLRDEGLAYAKKLQSAGVNVKLHVFPGVPHSFAEFWELDATQRFWRDIREGLEEWLT